jgi:hypothetical protein
VTCGSRLWWDHVCVNTHVAARARGRSGFPGLALVVVAVVGLVAGAGGAAILSGAQPDTGAAGASALSSAPSAEPVVVDEPTPTLTPAVVSTPAAPADGRTQWDIAAGLLTLDVPTRAGGTLVVVPGHVPAPGPGTVHSVRIEVEAGLPVDPAVFAEFVMTTLNDPRGWGAGGKLSFARTDDSAELRVVLASPDKVDALCAPLHTAGVTSCGTNGRATLNYMRWVAGTPEFTGEMLTYRQYVVNHEVGHLLGHPHQMCPGAGNVAPVMQQQTLGVAPCIANAWPHP